MKIEKILRINNFATFDDFRWNRNCKEFGKYNFFYGWNYSGKTTLSRIFRCLEIEAQLDDFIDAEFCLQTDKGKITQQDVSNDYPIRVFSEDFVEDNFQWNNEKAKVEPVLILGKEAKDLEIRAKELRRQKGKLEKTLEKTEEKKKRKKRELDSDITDKASGIRSILGITNPRKFDKNKLKDKIRTIKDTYQSCILSIDEEEKTLNIYRSKKAEKIAYEIPQLKLSTFIEEVKNILSKKVTAHQVIKKLKANPKLSDWVKKGIDLHQNEEVCQFCGNPLPSDLFERLNKHFSFEFDSLMNQIEQKEEEICSYIEQVRNLNFPDKARLFEGLQKKFENKLELLNIKKDNYIKTLELLKSEIKRKREKPFDSIEIQRLSDNTEEMKNAFGKIESIINIHNSKVDSFETEKKNAKDDLINHFTAKFIKDKSYFKVRKKIKKLEESIQTLKSEIEDLDNEIEDINNKIIAEAVGADKINGYLKQFFNDDKLRVEITNDGKYKLYRSGQIAKNLSTGEKNVISLVYFFTKLEETGFDFNNAVIFIDDPVSSLDSNHTYKIYGFINEKLRDCNQLFITTHNFDFFNLLKDLSKYDLSNGGKFYLVKKVKNQTSEFSYIENLPNVLIKYKSEYNYLFSILKLFKGSSNKSNFELLYLLPNILRRFFEAYLFMKYPDGRKFKEKTKKFLKGTNKSDRQKALKLMNEYSHEENPTHIKIFPDIEEAEDAIRFILETIKRRDPEHYEALCESLERT